jgi:hypothetical protein
MARRHKPTRFQPMGLSDDVLRLDSGDDRAARLRRAEGAADHRLDALMTDNGG